jgi:hypothetical protein
MTDRWMLDLEGQSLKKELEVLDMFQLLDDDGS